jgi:hypothetical protein
MANLPGQQLTDMWMVDPTMFDPTQRSNQFSTYNNRAMPFPPSYGNPFQSLPARGPVNAATGRPIQSYQDWANSQPSPQAAPQGTTLNTQPQQGNPYYSPQIVNSLMAAMGPPPGNPGGFGGQAAQSAALSNYANNMSPLWTAQMQFAQGAQPGGAGAPQAQQANAAPASQGGPQNNWYQALQALANPWGPGGGPQTQGATVPLQQGYQPSGGVNQAFLNQRGWGGAGPAGTPGAAPMGGGPPTNQNFLSALAAIQGRPQQF